MAPSTQPQSPRRARPQSVLAQDFSAALDDLFKLNGLGALELSVEEKKDDLLTQRRQLSSLEQQLRETEQRLKQLEAKHRRNRSQNMLGNRRDVRTVSEEDENGNEGEGTDDSGGDSRSEGEVGQRPSR